MNYTLIATLGIFFLAVLINSILQALIVWHLNKVRILFKKEFPSNSDPLILLAGKLIPKGTPLKDKIFKSSQIAEKRLMEILNNENSMEINRSSYAPSLHKIALFNMLYNWVLGITIVLIIIINLFF